MTDNVINMFGDASTPAPVDGVDTELLEKEFKYRVAEYLKLVVDKINSGDYDFNRMVIIDTSGDLSQGSDEVNLACFGLMSSVELVGILEHAKFVAMSQSMEEQ
jgi:hypothetical protein